MCTHGLGQYRSIGDSVNRLWIYCAILAGLMALGLPVWADAVWHCSRTPLVDVATDNRPDPGDLFTLAEQGVADDVILISVRDLIDVYSGVNVRLSGVPLSACFMPVNDPVTGKTLRALGLSADVLSALARKSAIAKSHLYRVTNEEEMKTCIARNQPAVGYLTQAQVTEKLAPCF
jgi:hypothetical protein